MLNRISKEIQEYRTGSVQLLDGVNFSAAKLIRRIGIYKSHVYPTGELDSQGNKKYWFDVISPRVNNEVKNIDFDTSDIILFSDSLSDAGRVMIANVALKDWLDESGQAAKINEAIEQCPEWGNIVWKKKGNDYEILDLQNFMVLNQTARDLSESDVIEEGCFVSSDLMKMSGVWSNVDTLVSMATKDKKHSTPEFYIYERNGEMSKREYMQLKMELDNDKTIDLSKFSDKEFVLAKVVVGGVTKDKPSTVLFCDEISKKPFKEFHRSSYRGTWLRSGLYEQLMDIQTRANEIGNQIARGLEWASKTIFRSNDKIIAQNIITDLENGDIIKSGDLAQVEVRMQGLDQLIADWNRLMVLADQISNSSEVVSGGNLPSGTPFRLGALQNINANKLYDFIREKLAIALQSLIQEWILPSALKSIKAKEVVRLSSDSGYLTEYYKMIVDSWYIKNLATFPPHSAEMAQNIKQRELDALMQKKEVLVNLEDEMWEDFKPRVKVAITGENYNLAVELETLQTFIALEQDPVRRTALIEIAMGKKGIDAKSLPKTPPVQPQQQAMAQTPEARPKIMTQLGASPVV
ncbi:MAG: hypothetical protein WC346_01365 [Methanogenium sp.]|jgi:hypothetical protein